jgi:hypothetical protein
MVVAWSPSRVDLGLWSLRHRKQGLSYELALPRISTFAELPGLWSSSVIAWRGYSAWTAVADKRFSLADSHRLPFVEVLLEVTVQCFEDIFPV